MQGALQFIVPILMQTLAKQEDFDDEDDWNPCKVRHIFSPVLPTYIDRRNGINFDMLGLLSFNHDVRMNSFYFIFFDDDYRQLVFV